LKSLSPGTLKEEEKILFINTQAWEHEHAHNLVLIKALSSVPRVLSAPVTCDRTMTVAC